MATIIISDLQEKTFLDDLNSEQIQQILGTGIIPFWNGGPDVVQLSTVYDGINARQTSYRGPFGLYDNKFFTLDFARSNYYFIIWVFE